ncbi:unnamed protein product [Pleuronectes platessa]|uniref:Uncharacterized protein n=1 Tax=Pleuronectes platessa TaxID=8262 RepID=A0A9N7UU72_PLEPL|nr:unnamed protein product [Pleuronectes platessa]
MNIVEETEEEVKREIGDVDMFDQKSQSDTGSEVRASPTQEVKSERVRHEVKSERVRHRKRREKEVERKGDGERRRWSEKEVEREGGGARRRWREKEVEREGDGERRMWREKEVREKEVERERGGERTRWREKEGERRQESSVVCRSASSRLSALSDGRALDAVGATDQCLRVEGHTEHMCGSVNTRAGQPWFGVDDVLPQNHEKGVWLKDDRQTGDQSKEGSISKSKVSSPLTPRRLSHPLTSSSSSSLTSSPSSCVSSPSILLRFLPSASDSSVPVHPLTSSHLCLPAATHMSHTR